MTWTRVALIALVGAVLTAVGPVAAQTPGGQTPLPAGPTTGGGPAPVCSRVKDECDQGLTLGLCKVGLDLASASGRKACLKAGGLIKGMGATATCVRRTPLRACGY